MAAKLIGERLPLNWSYGVTQDGRIFFVNDNACETTWLHPVTGEPVQTGHSRLEDETDESDLEDMPHDLDLAVVKHGDIPPGWEQALTIDGSIYFIDHNNRRTTFDHPGTGRPIMEAPMRTAPQTPQTPNRANTNRKSGKGSKLKAPTASREENSKVIMRGWLQKQESGGLKLWKKKWAVVADYGLFFYKDDTEQTCIGSILLPSYRISRCGLSDVNKKYAFKAEHENMKTFYFATDNQYDMDKWLEALRVASLVQKAPGQMQKLIPKSPIMSWTDTMESPGISPPNMDNYPFSGTDPRINDQDAGFRERSPLQSRENTHDYSRNSDPRHYDHDPNRSMSIGYPDSNRSFQDPSRSFNQDPNRSYSERGSQRGSQANYPTDNYGSLPRGHPGPQGQHYRSNDPNTSRQFDPRYQSNISDRGSVRSSQSQGRLPPDQSSRSYDPRSQPGSYTSNTLPRDMRYGNQDNKGQPRGQQYNSLPRDQRDSRSKLSPGEGPFSQSSPRQPGPGRRKEDNPYMMMSSPQKERKMDPTKNSNRPLPQEPPPEPIHERNQSGGGDYASLTRIKERWPNQNLSRPVNEDMVQQSNQGGSLQAKRPDLYVDIPPTYVNVFDQSQIRDEPPALPSRPPLPVEMRPKLVADLAMGHSPNTQSNMLEAEHNLEQRMRQPPFFNYPTPTRESLPAFPQESPRSQYSQRSQRSNDPRSRAPEDTRGQRSQQRPDVAPVSRNVEAPLVKQETAGSYRIPRNYDPDTSDTTDNLNGSDNTLTNEERNDKISEFYGLGKYNEKNGGQGNKNRIMSDLDVRVNTLPVKKPAAGVTGEKDFRMRSLPDHAQSMPAIYHEQQPLSIEVPERPVNNSYLNMAPNMASTDPRHDDTDQNTRKSAFRPLSSASNSLQKLANESAGPPGQSGDYGKLPGYPDQYHQTDPKRLSAASSQMSQPRSSWKQDNLPGQQYLGQGHYAPDRKGHRKNERTEIQTVKEEPDMPDSQVITTDLPKRNFLLNGPRLRMSISATDLLGKTHDELVLLLIQLRRDKADLNTQRDGLRKTIEQMRPTEFYYRKLQNEGRPIDSEKEQQHRKYVDMKRRLEDVEKRLEVYKPLVNLVCNMVTMGSLYGGDNLMLATEYRKHLLSPDQYSPPKKMLEFSRKHQEDQVVQGIEEDIKHLTQEQADLEEKLDRLYELDRVMQDQSFQVTSLREDKEMLEKALGGLLKKQDQNGSNPVELDKLRQQQRTIEKELSRVLQQLAECSKELEETTAENNRIEHEVALLRSKVHGDVSRSKSAPSLSSESLRTKMKMEKDLAKVQNMMEGLTERGAQLQEMMSSLRRPQKGGDTQKPLSPLSPVSPTQKGSQNQALFGKGLKLIKNLMKGLTERGAQLQEMMSSLRRPQKGADSHKPLSPLSPVSPTQKGTDRVDSKSGLTYYETDLDTNETKDLAQVTALLASYKLIPGQETGDLNQEPMTFQTSATSYSSPPAQEPMTYQTSASSYRSPPASGDQGSSAFRTVNSGRAEEDPTFHASPIQTFLKQTAASQNNEQPSMETDGPTDQWDIGAADDNTKRFYGLIPKNMPKSQTVRDVKRHSESRKKKEDDPPPLRVGVIPSDSSVDYTDSNFPVYENLPQTKTSASDIPAVSAPWASVASDNNNPTGSQRRRSLLHLMTPKPFTKTPQYSSVHNISSPHDNLDNTDQSESFIHTQPILASQSQDLEHKPYDFESSQLNSSTTSTDPVMQISSSKAPPPPPVRGTSKRINMDSFGKSNIPYRSSFRGHGHSDNTAPVEIPPPPRNYVLPEPAILNKKSSRNSRATNKDRYLTISSSQPIKLEKNVLQSPKLTSQAGDLISSVPDIVKSSTSRVDQIDERTIDREILFYPQKVEIPERYVPDSDDESVTEEEKEKRREKANKIKKILTQQSVHSLSQPDVSKVAGEVHERVQQEKQKRAHLLGISQELAEEVKRKSRQFAAERRKTWSGSPQKSPNKEDNSGEFSEGNQLLVDDPNNNSYTSSKDDSGLIYTDHRTYNDRNSFDANKDLSGIVYTDNSYSDNQFNNQDNRDYNDSYYDSFTKGDYSQSTYADYNSTSYSSQPNFKI